MDRLAARRCRHEQTAEKLTADVAVDSRCSALQVSVASFNHNRRTFVVRLFKANTSTKRSKRINAISLVRWATVIVKVLAIVNDPTKRAITPNAR